MVVVGVLIAPTTGHAISIGPNRGVSTISGSSSSPRALRPRVTLAARYARILRENRVLKARLAKERRATGGLTRQVARLNRQVRSLNARVAKLMRTVRELKLRLSTVFGQWRKAVASTYGIGDGLLGSGLAGSGRLTADRPVFAHKNMAFGTKVQFRYKSRTFVGECQDRGPFIAGREFDLGPRIARELGFDGVSALKWRIVRRK